MTTDPALTIGGETASEEDIRAIRALYGYDRPVWEQYIDWALRALTGDFGVSYHYRERVSTMIAGRIGTTMTLGSLAILFALAVSIPLGVVAAMRPNSLIDRLALLIAVFGQALPTFWFALMMIIVFGVWWRWLPISGNDSWAHFVMPTIALGYYATPALMRLTRAGMIEVLSSDYIRTARAKGLSPTVVLFKHALRNAIIPVVSLSAVWFGFMLGGSIVIETIFNLKGIGWLSYDALLRADLPVVQAIVLIFASFYVVLTLLADLLNAYLDPRISVR
jgi:peptide/nickel transport system permease protein